MFAMKKNPIKYEVYDVQKSYEENFEAGPNFSEPMPKNIPVLPSKTKIFDFELNSPLGIPAGPLLNSKFIKFYAEMGFDIPVYKTVRSVERGCHAAPNCVFVNQTTQFTPTEGMSDIQTTAKPEFLEDLVITNSFGVPSKPVLDWQADIELAHSYLSTGQIMPVSINGTAGAEGRTLAEDFAYTAAMAKEAGAKIIIANYSCPNIASGKEGSVYCDPQASTEISAKIRAAIGNTPFLIKLGNMPAELLATVVANNRPYVDGFAGINTIPKFVRNPDGTQALPGENRLKSGLCGAAIRDVSQLFVENLNTIRTETNDDFVIFGTGGMMTPDHLNERLSAGSDVIMAATSAMWNPYLAIEWKKSLLK